MEKRLVKIGEASALLGVTPQTLRKWEKTGELLPDRRSKTGTRYYDVNKLMGINNTGQPTVCYAAFPLMIKKQTWTDNKNCWKLIARPKAGAAK